MSAGLKVFVRAARGRKDCTNSLGEVSRVDKRSVEGRGADNRDASSREGVLDGSLDLNRRVGTVRAVRASVSATRWVSSWPKKAREERTP